MKLYLYTGVALRNIVPVGQNFDTPPRNPELLKSHENEMPCEDTKKVYFIEDRLCPENQVRLIEILLNENQDKRNVQIFTHSPYVLDMAYWTGKKLGYEVKGYDVIFSNKEETEVEFSDPTGGNMEHLWISLNKAIHIIEKVEKEVKGE